jgi:hypothetical protein
MFYTHTTYLGIDPTAGGRPFTYAALDHELGLLALGQGNMEEVLAFVAGQRSALVAVCAPRRPNQGLMERPEVRERLSPVPRPGRWRNFRQAEYQLRQLHITVPQTPAEEDDCSGWMRKGFTLYRRLESLDYRPYPQEEATHQCLEVYPHACYAVLLGRTPLPKHTLEGRLQRQLILYEKRLNIPDPMTLFEEITRYRLLQGILPLENLYPPQELDALVAAYTAWLAAEKPDGITLLGDSEEGHLVLPSAELKSHYS